MAQADQLDFLKLLLEANDVRVPGRPVYQKLYEHGVTTLSQFARLSKDKLEDWGIAEDKYDDKVCTRALPDAQRVRLLVDRSHDLAPIRQQLLDRALYWACDCGDVARAKELLSMGVNVNYHYSDHKQDGRTPLHSCAENGHKDIISLLLNTKGINVNDVDGKGRCPSHYAAIKGHLDIFKMLVKNGASESLSLQDKSFHRCPLHYAALGGHVDITKILVENEVSLSLQDKDGRCPLHHAAQRGHLDITRILVKNGASFSMQDKDGFTPLHYAARHGYLDIVKILKENGASFSMQNKRGRTPLDLAKERKQNDVIEYLQRPDSKSQSATTPTATPPSTDATSQKPDSKSQSATTPTETPPSTDATSQKSGDEDHSSTTADEDTHTDSNTSPVDRVGVSSPPTGVAGTPHSQLATPGSPVASSVSSTTATPLTACQRNKGDTPTLLEIMTMKRADGRPLKIVETIAASDYKKFGMFLLQDENGAAVDILQKNHISEGAEAVTQSIIKKWLTSGAPTRSYQHLIECLRQSELGALAEEIATNTTVMSMSICVASDSNLTTPSTQQVSGDSGLTTPSTQQESVKQALSHDQSDIQLGRNAPDDKPMITPAVSTTTKSPTHQNILDTKPEITTLNCFKYKDAVGRTQRVFITDEIGTSWNRVGLSLNFTASSLDSIESTCHGNVMKCCNRLLTLWLEGHVQDVSQAPITWETLLEALRDSRLGQLADNLTDLLTSHACIIISSTTPTSKPHLTQFKS